MIPINKCKNGYVYIIYARNAYLGIYDKKKKGFRISRFKSSNAYYDPKKKELVINDRLTERNYEFVEYHWDTGEPYGTAKPYKELFKAPKLKDEKEFLEYMNYLKIEREEEIAKVLTESDDEDYALHKPLIINKKDKD